jgi:hypothetical protein
MFNYRRERPSPVSMRGPHLAVIVNVDDPDKTERVRARITGLHDGVADSDLPWLRPNRNGLATSSQGNVGSKRAPPPVGTNVWVKFDNDSQYFGVYTGVPLQKNHALKEATGNDATGQNYKKTDVDIDEAGNRFTHDRERNLIAFEHASGAYISMDGKGHVAIRSADKQVGDGATEKNSPGIVMHIKGGVHIVCDKDVNIGGNNINVVSSGDLTVAAGRNLILTAKGTVIMPQATNAKMPVPDLPTVEEPQSRTPPTLQAPSDPTSASSGPS